MGNAQRIKELTDQAQVLENDGKHMEAIRILMEAHELVERGVYVAEGEEESDAEMRQLDVMMRTVYRISILPALGRNYRVLEDYDQARTWLTRAYSIAPKMPSILNELAMLEYDAGFYKESARRAEEVHRLDATRNEPHSAAKAHWVAAMAYLRLGNNRRAIEHASRSLELYPDLAETRYTLAKALLHDERYEQAVKQYERTLVVQPRHAGVFVDLIHAYNRLHDLPKAVEVGLLGVERVPKDGHIQLNLASVYAQQGNVEKAIRYTKMSFENGYATLERIAADKDFDEVRANSEFDAYLKSL